MAKAKLSKKDLLDIKRLVSRAMVDKEVRDAILNGTVPSGVKRPSDAAMKVLGSITSDEMDALGSLYQSMRDAGASASLVNHFIL